MNDIKFYRNRMNGDAFPPMIYAWGASALGGWIRDPGEFVPRPYDSTKTNAWAVVEVEPA